MSGLAAVAAFDRDPSILSTLHTVIAAAAHRAPDGSALWHDGLAALGLLRHRLFEDRAAAPVSDGRLALVFDGRLDYRDDLMSRLGIRGGAALDDDALALTAFARWGDTAVERLEGDFAFVLWDAAERRIVAGRDPIGMRPLHWMRIGQRLLFASEVAQLVAACGSAPAPDESAVADLLAGDPPSDDRTLFRDIRRVPPGSVVIADQHGIAWRRYWTPTPCPGDPSRGDADFAAACRALVDAAVRARMRGIGRSAVFFSGGVDSSVVLTVAAGLARREHAVDPLAVSLVFDDPSADERAFQDAVRRTVGVDTVSVRPDEAEARVFYRQAGERCGLPDLPSDFAGRRLRTAALSAGARFALTGAGGDPLFSGSVHRYADLLSRGRIVAAVREYGRDRWIDSSGWSRGALLTAGIWPLLAARHRTRLRRVACRISGISDERSWLRLRRDPIPVVPDPPRGVSHASWEVAWSFRDGWTAHFLEAAERIDAELGFDERHPLLDRRLVDFALSLPEEQRCRDGVMKFVLRRAVPELAPDVARRMTKGDFSTLMRDAFTALGGTRFFRSLAIAELGWVDGAALAARYDRLAHVPIDDAQAGRDLPMLWIVAATDVWFRAVYQRSEGAISA